MHDKSPCADDDFRPPEIPTQVCCYHCRREYDSYLMHWVVDAHYQAGGYWACPTPGCDGKGFTFDVWPTDPDWTDENGQRVCFEDEDSLVDDEGNDDLSEDWIGDDEVIDDIQQSDDEPATELDDELTCDEPDWENREWENRDWEHPAPLRPTDTVDFRGDDDLPV